MGFWADLGDKVLGKSAGSFDPYAKDRAVRMDALKGAMAQYDQMMSQPFGFIPQAYQDQMRKDVTEQQNNQYQGQGQTGFAADRMARAQNDLSMKMLQTNMGQANKQRDYIQQLETQNQPEQYQKAQEGLLSQVGGQMASKAGNELGGKFADWAGNKMFGNSENSDERNQGGMGVNGSTSDYLRSNQG